MNRENFIKIIPKPSNEDVILYDTSLADLIDVDVSNEYHKLLPVFKEMKKNFIKIKEEIKTYNEIINQMFLYDPSWSEETYLQKLQDDMRIYSISYNNIKKIEDEIKILRKKIEAINDKIVVQTNKENKDIEERKLNLSNDIENNKASIIKYKDSVDIYKSNLKRIEQQIKNSKEDLKMLKLSVRQLSLGEYKCFCCDRTITKDKAEPIFNKIQVNIQNKTNEINVLLEEKDKIKNSLNYYKDKLLKEKITLQNNSKFKSNYNAMYIKKSMEILKLEASRNECLNKISELEYSLNNEPSLKSKKFLELKNRIEKYKISLENLKKIKSIRASITRKINVYEQKENNFEELKKKITKYLAFLNIYYKIYEQKASQYAGPDYKIKLFEIKDLDTIEILNIIYKDVEYSQLSKRNKDIVDKNLIEKFSLNF